MLEKPKDEGSVWWEGGGNDSMQAGGGWRGAEFPVTVSVIGPTLVFSVSGLKANCSGEEARLLGKSRPI